MNRSLPALAERQYVNVTLVDTETTGYEAEVDEVIGIGLLCLRVEVSSGAPQELVGNCFQWREPVSMSKEVEAIVGIRKAELRGLRFDGHVIDQVLSLTDLVVAHNAAFERPFLERVIPAFADIPWACSLEEVGWREEGLPQASIDFLLSRHGMPPSGGRPEDDCRALAYLLAQPLPRSPGNGFRRLIQAADAVSLECLVLGNAGRRKATQEVFSTLGLQKSGVRWRVDCPCPGDAARLEDALIDRALADSAFATLEMRRVDSRSRFTARSEWLRVK